MAENFPKNQRHRTNERYGAFGKMRGCKYSHLPVSLRIWVQINTGVSGPVLCTHIAQTGRIQTAVCIGGDRTFVSLSLTIPVIADLSGTVIL